MILTKRTKLSLAQLISLLDPDVIEVLFGKHDIACCGSNSQIEISDALLNSNNTQIETLIEEVVATIGALRNRVTPKYKFDERWQDLTKCMLLDGYQINSKKIIKTEPFLEGVESIEDDLFKELENSGLSEYTEIQIQIRESENDFRKALPDFNGCLSHSRIALETLVKKIAGNFGFRTNNESKAWGESLAYLKKKDFINKKEEEALSSVYTLISDGSHIPLGFTEEEYVRFGRNLATSMVYFMIKLFNGSLNLR
jgi:hypothetical protein